MSEQTSVKVGDTVLAFRPERYPKPLAAIITGLHPVGPGGERRVNARAFLDRQSAQDEMFFEVLLLDPIAEGLTAKEIKAEQGRRAVQEKWVEPRRDPQVPVAVVEPVVEKPAEMDPVAALNVRVGPATKPRTTPRPVLTPAAT
jgi:hypothetical protein